MLLNRVYLITFLKNDDMQIYTAIHSQATNRICYNKKALLWHLLLCTLIQPHVYKFSDDGI